MQNAATSRLTWLAIAAASAYVFWDAGRAFNLTDEFWYAQITREMLAGGDWITPHFDGAHDFNKPPLYFWLSAPLAALFPDRVAMRIVPGLSFVGILLLVRWIAVRELGSRAALIAVSAFALTADHLLHHGYKSGVVDGLLNLESTAVFALTLDLRRQPTRLRWIGVLLGLAFLTKTVFAIFPAALVGAELWRLRREKVIDPWLIAQSGILGGLVAGAWLGALWVANGAEALTYLLGDQALSRLVGDQEVYAASGRVTGRDEWLYVVRHMLTWSQPWSWIGALALGQLLSSRHPARPQLLVLAGFWFAIVIALFSVSRGHWPWYTSSAYVPLAILVGWLFDRWLDGEWSLWTRSLVPVTAGSLLVLPVPLEYNPFVRQATCAPLDPLLALQVGVILLLALLTLAVYRSGPVTRLGAQVQLGGIGVLALARFAQAGAPEIAAPLYTNGGRCLFPWPESGAIFPGYVLLMVAVAAAVLTGVVLARRSVQRSCIGVLFVLSAGYVLGPALRYGLSANERAEVRWMRSAIARGVFENGQSREVRPSNRYLGVVLFAEFGADFDISYTAALSRTLIRPREKAGGSTPAAHFKGSE